MKITVILASAAVSAITLAATPASAVTHHEVRDLPNWSTKSCKTEGSTNCRWTATGPRAQGNGKGHTFIRRTLPDGTVCTFYVQPKYAAKHDHCE